MTRDDIVEAGAKALDVVESRHDFDSGDLPSNAEYMDALLDVWLPLILAGVAEKVRVEGGAHVDASIEYAARSVEGWTP